MRKYETFFRKDLFLFFVLGLKSAPGNPTYKHFWLILSDVKPYFLLINSCIQNVQGLDTEMLKLLKLKVLR